MKNFELITSSQNSQVKLLRSLEKKKYRLREELFIAEGINVILEAERHNLVKYLFVDDEKTSKSPASIRIVLNSD